MQMGHRGGLGGRSKLELLKSVKQFRDSSVTSATINVHARTRKGTGRNAQA